MEAYPDEVEMEDMVVDDEKQCQWRIQFGENEVGIYYNIVYYMIRGGMYCILRGGMST